MSGTDAVSADARRADVDAARGLADGRDRGPTGTIATGAERGAYGLTLSGVDTAAANTLLVEAPVSWPLVTIAHRRGSAPAGRPRLTLEDAWFPFPDGGGVLVDRARRLACYTSPTALGPQELVHPYLAPAAATFARWHGHEAFHAAGIAIDGRVWGLLGGKGMGKSTTVAWLAREGYVAFGDDLLVVDRARAYCGPRCIDLREASARGLGIGERLVPSDERPRWRVTLGAVPPELPIAGWISLAWGDGPALEVVPPAERLALLGRNSPLRSLAFDPLAFLNLAALPTFTLRRPRALVSLAASVDLLLDAASNRYGVGVGRW